jgi:nucleoside-diphosphate-sugar epimerase
MLRQMDTKPTQAPNTIRDVEHLEDLLSEPTPGVIQTMARMKGDVIVLGVGGKMGPTLARMMKRAADAAAKPKRIIGVARFSSPGLPQRLHDVGIEPVQCDLLDRAQIDQLPEVENVVYMAGMKFGSTGNEPLTWAMNTFLPALVCEKFRNSRIVAFSTGNVYGLVPATSGGSCEGDPLRPEGEYAMSCLGRERMFEHFSKTMKIPMALIRLNYAVELRYGVLLDIAQRVWRGETIDVSMGHVNVIWQRDANAHSIEAFDHVATPALLLNVAGSHILRVRDVAQHFARKLGKEPHFCAHEATDALLNNASRSHGWFGAPGTSVDQMIDWIADWVRRGGSTLDKPTHFETRDGRF